MSNVAKAVNVEDLRRMARRRLPHFLGDYVEGGAGTGAGVRRNIDAFRQHHFIPRAFADVGRIDTSVKLFGRAYSSLFGFSPVGTGGLYRRRFDAILADTAREANIPFILSGAATASVEEIGRRAPDHTWFQLYASKDERVTDHIIGRVRDAGVKVLVFTVDYPIAPRSEVATRTGVSLASGPTWRTFPSLFWDALTHPSWSLDFLLGGGMPKLESWAPYAPTNSSTMQVGKFYSENWPGNPSWSLLERVRRAWPGTLIVKGLVHPDDVIRVAELGADAATVSNHGGNKLDCMQASLDALAWIKSTVKDRIPLFFDGGIRRGADIVAAHALGASFCFIGRSAIYGAAAGGRLGARRTVDILQSEIAYTMAMIGCAARSEIGPQVLRATEVPPIPWLSRNSARAEPERTAAN